MAQTTEKHYNKELYDWWVNGGRLDLLIDELTTQGDTNETKLDTLLSPATRIVQKAAANLPQATQTAYFTVTGRVLITNIIGEVTTEIEGQETVIKLIANPTVGADVDLCAALDINGDAVGTLYTITGTLANAMIATTSGAVAAQAGAVLVAAGTIDLDTADDSSTGQTKWTVHYIPLDSGSTIA